MNRLHRRKFTTAIAQIGENLNERERSMASSLVMPLTNHTDDLPRFFFFHGMFNGDGFSCWPLAAQMKDRMAFVAVHPHGTIDPAIPPSIEAMAADLLPAILEVQNVGPFYLGGFCVGGLVAFEVARLLSELGQIVRHIVLISTRFPTARLNRAFSVIRQFVRGDVTIISNVLRDKSLSPVTGQPINVSRNEHYRRAYDAYRPKPTNGKISLIVGDASMALTNVQFARWALLTNSLTIATVSGGHYCIEANAKVIANVCLQTASFS